MLPLASVVITSPAPAADVAEEDSGMKRPIQKRKLRDDLKKFQKDALKECRQVRLVKVKNLAWCKMATKNAAGCNLCPYLP